VTQKPRLSLVRHVILLELALALCAHAQNPAITQVLNSATLSGQSIAPGLLVTVVGTNLAADALQFCVANDTAPLSCNGVAVTINGKAAPLFQTLANQLAIEVPTDITGSSATLQVTRVVNGQTLQSAAFTIPVTTVAPGMYTNLQNGVTVGSFIDKTGALVQIANATQPGDVLTVVGTGAGVTSPLYPAGPTTPDSPAYPSALPVTVSVGGKPAVVSFAGLGPGYIGVDAVTFTVPQGLDGGLLPVVMSVGGVASPAVALPIAGAKVSVSSVVNGASGKPGVASGSWLTIYGSNLAATLRSWQASDFVGNRLPPSLDGVTVTVNGKSAAIAYVSPTQLNVLAPADTATGPVQVVITDVYGSGTGTATLQQYAPGLFSVQGGKYAAAVHVDGTYVAPPGVLGSGVTSSPAKPGETILLFGTGFGGTTPAAPADQIVSTAAPLTDLTRLRINIGAMPAAVPFGGITAAGVYQFNVVVPAAPDGDQPLDVSIAGVSAQTGLAIAVKN
jgi:uncharacterized protein (TIGR03437 family)